MNKTWQLAALAATAVLGALGSAQAQGDIPAPDHTGLNLNGAVGMPLNATANIPAAGGVRVQANYFDMGEHDSTLFNSADFRFYGLHAAGRVGDGPFEINGGVEKLHVGNTNDPDIEGADNTGLAIGGKWQFWRNEEGDLFVAVGGGYSRVLAKNLYAYLVATKTFDVGRRGVAAHLGVRYDRFKVSDISNVADDDSSKASIYGGVEVPIDRQGRFAFVGELQSKNNDFNNGLFGDITSGDAKALYSASVRYQANGWAASLGVARRGYPGIVNDGSWFAQVGKTF